MTTSPDGSRKRVTVAICTYDRYDYLERCIDSVLAQSLPAEDYDVIVVDNSPDQDLAARHRDALEPRGKGRLRYLLEPRPGLSNARNVATAASDGELIAFIDDDAVATDKWLENIVKAFDVFGAEAGVVGGRIDPIWEAPRPPWLADRMLGHLSVVNWGGTLRVAKPEEWFAGANVTYRRTLLEEVGGFSVGLGRMGAGASLLSNEEIALHAAAVERGYQLLYAPEARVSHLVEAKRLSREWLRKRIAWQAASDILARPEETQRDLAQHWRQLEAYLDALPPAERQLRGLYLPTDDPELFQWQLGAIYALTISSLTGLEGPALASER